jgi:hypothetical protein
VFARPLSTADLSFPINVDWGGGFILTNSSLPIALETVDSSALYNLISTLATALMRTLPTISLTASLGLGTEVSRNP